MLDGGGQCCLKNKILVHFHLWMPLLPACSRGTTASPVLRSHQGSFSDYLWLSWLSEQQHFSGRRRPEFLFRGSDGQLQLVAMSLCSFAVAPSMPLSLTYHYDLSALGYCWPRQECVAFLPPLVLTWSSRLKLWVLTYRWFFELCPLTAFLLFFCYAFKAFCRVFDRPQVSR